MVTRCPSVFNALVFTTNARSRSTRGTEGSHSSSSASSASSSSPPTRSMKRQEAIAFFQHKVDENPMDADAHHNLAVLFRSQGDATMHARHSRIAWLTQCGGPKVWNERVLALMDMATIAQSTDRVAVDGAMNTQQAQDEAWRILNETMTFWPTFPGSYANASVLLARRGRYTEALPYCQRAVELAPSDPAMHRNAARVYEQLGRSAEAEKHYRQALALTPGDADLAKRLALMSLAGVGERARREDAAAHFYSRYRSLRGEHYDLKL
jgi:Flp pilus assembly protein TadD